MPQALSGTRRSVPKICRINGDDNKALIYKNLGNNHAVPFLWGDKFTVVSGAQQVVLASGIKFHGKTLASDGNVTASPMSDPGAVRWWVEKDTGLNTVVIKTSAAVGAAINFDCQFMLGDDADVDGLYCRGNRGTMPSYP